MLNKTNGKKDKNLLIAHAWEKLANMLEKPKGAQSHASTSCTLIPQLLLCTLKSKGAQSHPSTSCTLIPQFLLCTLKVQECVGI